MAYKLDYSPLQASERAKGQAFASGFKAIGDKINTARTDKRRKALVEKATMSNDPQEVAAAKAELAANYPGASQRVGELNNEMLEKVGAETEAKKKAMVYDLAEVSSLHQSGQPEAAINYLDRRAEAIDARGGDSRHTREIRDMYASDSEKGGQYIAMSLQSMINPEEFAKRLSPDGTSKSDVAAIQTFEYLTAGLPEKDRAAARRIKLGLDPRASTSAEAAALKEFAKTTAKLQARFKLEPEVASAVAAAVNEASATAKALDATKSGEAAWSVYDKSMSNLALAMGGADTGPVVGLIPAVTANQQIADGAVAVMAPVLKQVFRAAGEGIFTDKDQELLMAMAPSRRDGPKARVAKIMAIDTIVRAKLGVGDHIISGARGGQNGPPTVSSQEEYDKLPSGTLFIEDGKQYRKP